MYELSFTEEAERYANKLASLRSPGDLKLIDNLASQIDCSSADTFIVIPAHVRERALKESLLAYSNAGADKQFLCIIFLNGGPDITAEEFEKLTEKRLSEVRAAQLQLPQLKFTPLVHHFSENSLLSRIRGVITDALVKACHQQQIADPVLVSNDADALVYSFGYLKELRSVFKTSPELDYLSGTIYWSGCDEDGRIRYEPPLAMPEIFLSDVFGQIVDEIYRQHGSIYATGCNSAFRLASIAAINGYDYDFFPFFDVEIGNVMDRFRFDRHGAETEKSFARFMKNCRLTTNPRRAILALLNNVPYGEQFNSVATHLGADLDLSEYASAYVNTPAFMQAADLLSYYQSEKKREKVHSRIAACFVDFIKGEAARNKKALAEHLCPRVGLEIEHLVSEDSDLRSISFNWKNSSLPAMLVNWIELNCKTSTR